MGILAELTWVEIKLFVREPITMAMTFGLPLLFMPVMNGVFGNTPDPELYRGVGALDYYVPAYFGLVITSIGVMALPVHLTAYRERGVLRRLRASSIRLPVLLGSQIVVGFVIAVLGAILLAALAMLAFGASAPESFWTFLPAFVLGTVCFVGLGIFLGSVMPTTRAAQGLGLILFFLMLMLAGAGPPPEVMPEAMRIAGKAMPLHWVVLMMQDPWLGFGWNWLATGIVVGILVVSVVLAARFFRWE
jgi:ABC-2 type transport system permease protein